MKILRNPEHGVVIDSTRTMYPSRMAVVREPLEIPGWAVHCFGYVLSGTARIAHRNLRAELPAGSFFGVPGELSVYPMAENAAPPMVVVIERIGYRGQVVVGTIEDKGRLTYIDGCSDSMLVYPPRLGDPVLNHLYFPRGIRQTQHTHPSIRLGIVARGKGMAWGPVQPGQKYDRTVQLHGRDYWEEPLEPGNVFLLDAQEMHSFHTLDSDFMDVIAYHPDSDWGPQDTTHPMINRTYINASAFQHGTPPAP